MKGAFLSLGVRKAPFIALQPPNRAARSYR
jgi:hypothetical protein